MHEDPIDFAALTALAARSSLVTGDCICSKKSLASWENMPIALTEDQLCLLGSLAYADEEQMTLEEYHPDGTYYWSDRAPIAPRYFPYNLCQIWECKTCSRCFLRYEEHGAYHVEKRMRALDVSLLSDVPLR